MGIIKYAFYYAWVLIRRQIVFYDKYFSEFYDSQNNQVQEKIDFVLDLISNVEIVPSKFLSFM